MPSGVGKNKQQSDMLIIRLGIDIELCIMMEDNGGDCDGRMGDRSGNGICWK